jgi:thiol-disulfide isomerase/thioredoxin
MRKQFWIILLVTIFINAASILSGAINWNVQIVVSGMAFFVGGLYKPQRINAFWYFLILVFPSALLHGFLILKDHLIHMYLIVFMVYAALGLGLLMNAFVISVKRKRIYIGIITGFILSFYWINGFYLDHIFRLNQIEIENSIKTSNNNLLLLSLKDANKMPVKLSDFKGKVIVLDFWHTYCGACFRAFPEIEKVEQSFSSNNHVVFFSVGIPFRNQSINDLIATTTELPYDLNYLYADVSNRDSVLSIFQLEKYPTIVVIDKTGQLFYLGALHMNNSLINKSLKEIIEECLQVEHTK